MKKKGFTLIELLVVIAIIAMLLAILMPALGRVKKMAQRLVCGTNLKGLGNANNVYAFDYRDEFPIAGGEGNNTWATTTPKWKTVVNPQWEQNDNVTVAASLYMLVREADVGPKSFICKGSDETPFVNTTQYDIVELWDFGPNPADYQSYSYQLPYPTPAGTYPADGTSNPANAIMADKNPWFDPQLDDLGNINGDNYIEAVGVIDFTKNDWNIKKGNSGVHDRDGQNILFGDNHVSFEKRPDVGARFDNVYTTKAGQGSGGSDVQRRNGAAPLGIPSTNVKSQEDSVLVNDSWHK